MFDQLLVSRGLLTGDSGMKINKGSAEVVRCPSMLNRNCTPRQEDWMGGNRPIISLSACFVLFLAGCSESPPVQRQYCDGYNGPSEWRECGPQALEEPVPPGVFAAAEEAMGPGGFVGGYYGFNCYGGPEMEIGVPWRLGVFDDDAILSDNPGEDIVCLLDRYLLNVGCEGSSHEDIIVAKRDGVWKCVANLGGNAAEDYLGEYIDETGVDGCGRAWVESHSLWIGIVISSNADKGPLLFDLGMIGEQFASDAGLDGGPQEESCLSKEEFIEWYRSQLNP
jgi:hypothetical protein